MRLISIERGQNIASRLAELVPQQRRVDLDIHEKASNDKRKDETDKELNTLNEG